METIIYVLYYSIYTIIIYEINNNEIIMKYLNNYEINNNSS